MAPPQLDQAREEIDLDEVEKIINSETTPAVLPKTSPKAIINKNPSRDTLKTKVMTN